MNNNLQNMTVEEKKKYFLDKARNSEIENYNKEFDELFKDKDFLREILSTNVKTYSVLLGKASLIDEELCIEIFKEKYESTYIYDSDYPIKYALKSPTCYLNTKENNPYSFISFDDSVYMAEEVANWIIENNKFGATAIDKMYKNPRIVIAKLKKGPEFLYKLPTWAIDRNVYNYLQTVDIDIDKIKDSLIKNNPFIILLMLKKDKSFIENINEENINNEDLINFLVQSNYCYREGDNKILLTNPKLIISTINNGGIDYIIKNNISLNKETIDYIIDYVKNNNYQIKVLGNLSLIRDNNFMKFINNFYNVDNIYNLEDRYKFHYLLKDMDKTFYDYFGSNVTNMIINQIIKNNYDINMSNIFNVCSKRVFYTIYSSIVQTINHMDKEFDFCLFIKIVEYFNKNTSLLQDIVKNNNYDINKLITAIYSDFKLNSLDELNNIDITRVNNINNSNLSIKDKICMALVNSNYNKVKEFLKGVINVDNLLYLQLNYNKNSYEYNILETILPILEVLENLDYLDESDLQKLYDNLKTSKVSFIKNLDIISNNIRTLYANLYLKKKPDIDKLREKGKVETIDGVDIIDLTGEDFYLFSHNLHFNQEDTYKSVSIGETFTEFDRDDSRYTNYVCTTFEGRYNQSNLTSSKKNVVYYELDDVHDLIGFGNNDINTVNTKKPLYTMNPSYVNEYDMSFIRKGALTPTEFTFYRNKYDSTIKAPKYVLVNEVSENDIQNAKRLGYSLIKFDKEKNKESIVTEYNLLKENINLLSALDLYKLISLSKSIFQEDITDLISNIDLQRFNDRELRVINSALNRYNYNFILRKEDIEEKTM